MPSALSPGTQDNLKSALYSNRTVADISAKLHIHPSTVYRYAKKLKVNISSSRLGRPPIVPDATKNYIKIQIIRGQLQTAKDVYRLLLELEFSISYRSAVNVLKSMNFHAKLKKKKPLLTKEHMKRRLAWARKYLNWSVDQWRQVVFSDEVKINIWGSDGVKYYWVRPGDVLRPYHLDFTVKHGGGHLFMWGCITANGVGYGCQVYDGTMNSEVYQQILGTTYMETLGYYGLDKSQVYLQQDNDPKHKSKSTIKWLIENDVQYIDDWPAQSPDLNPIEHVWHQLKLQLSTYDTHARNVDELWERVDKEWNKSDADICRRYIDTMPSRIKAVIKAKGGHTTY
ncbi:hypothetical protein G6F43_012693 [Rhizopus delemar]|nr:hypothetical protein G6F43_012693 [Rhizopus delemar]